MYQDALQGIALGTLSMWQPLTCPNLVGVETKVDTETFHLHHAEFFALTEILPRRSRAYTVFQWATSAGVILILPVLGLRHGYRQEKPRCVRPLQ